MLWQRREMRGSAGGMASGAQLEADGRVKKLEELRLEKDVQMSFTLPAPGLADKVEEQNDKLENLKCSSAKL